MIESNSLHPLSEAILTYCKENKIDYEVNDESSIIPGMGLKIVKNGITYYAGNSELMQQIGITLDLNSLTNSFSKLGETVIYFARENEYLGYVSFQDEIRASSIKAIQLFKEQHIDVVMVTGDNETTAHAMASKCGITQVYARTTPNEKANIINKLKDKYRVIAFVGDGVNDAVALTTADVGIAIGTGSDVATGSADVILPHNDLTGVTTLISLSKKTINNIKMYQ